ncbi:MAG: hypothetical protein HOO06_11960 [Bdellovibrionaceae bacterium]|nr:hypothetical protein [Pseudobdellovibrionaceae bacterium]
MRSFLMSSFVIALFATIYPTQSQAEGLVRICEKAYYATGYVFLDQYVVTVDTDVIDAFESEVMWTQLHHPDLKILFTPTLYENGNYVFDKGVVYFYIEGDLNLRGRLQQLIDNLSELSAVRVACRYDI